MITIMMFLAGRSLALSFYFPFLKPHFRIYTLLLPQAAVEGDSAAFFFGT